MSDLSGAKTEVPTRLPGCGNEVVARPDLSPTQKRRRLRAGGETDRWLCHRNTSDFGLQRVLDDQSGYYLIGYRPGAETFNRGFHHIQARVKRRGLTVRTRAGFYGVTDEDERTAEPTNRSRLEQALISPFGANEVTVRLHTFFADDPVRGSMLRVTLLLDSNDLSVSNETDGAHKAYFDISAALFGDNGRIVARQEQTGTLRLRGRPYERALRQGMVYSFDMPVKQPGAFQFRVAISDSGSSRIGTAGRFLEIPNLSSGQLALSSILLQAEQNATKQENYEPESAKPEASAALQQPAGGGNATLVRWPAPLSTHPETKRLATPLTLLFSPDGISWSWQCREFLVRTIPSSSQGNVVGFCGTGVA